MAYRGVELDGQRVKWREKVVCRAEEWILRRQEGQKCCFINEGERQKQERWVRAAWALVPRRRRDVGLSARRVVSFGRFAHPKEMQAPSMQLRERLR